LDLVVKMERQRRQQSPVGEEELLDASWLVVVGCW
jgi:hypothetical protein